MTGSQVALIIVTHNSAGLLPDLASSLPAGTADVSTIQLVVDCASTDQTLDVVSEVLPEASVLALPLNVGYAAAINHGLKQIKDLGGATAVLVLNPDIRLRAGCLRGLLGALVDGRGGIAVPQLADEYGAMLWSLRARPSVRAVWLEAVLGGGLAGRLGLPSEVLRQPHVYESPRQVGWATGGIMLISAQTLAEVGEWDERYFLYEEEVEFCLRAADAGHGVVYVPDAHATRIIGDPRAAPWAQALMQVNRVRHLRSRGQVRRAQLARVGYLVGDLLRLGAGRTSFGPAASALLSDMPPQLIMDRFYPQVNAAVSTRRPATSSDIALAPAGSGRIAASIIIPAHNEERRIKHTLTNLLADGHAQAFEVIVVCNGCTDKTAMAARCFEPAVTVLEISEASKQLALSAGNRIARFFPRIYLDADITLTGASAASLAYAVQDSSFEAAAPSRKFSWAGVSKPVQYYYDVWRALPQVSTGLFGRGVIALSEDGYKTVAALPPTMSDDLAVSESVAVDKRLIVADAQATLRPPRNLPDLIRRRVRVATGNAQADQMGLRSAQARTSVSTLIRVCIKRPQLVFRMPIFGAVSVIGTLRSRRAVRVGDFRTWLRDESSRAA